MAFARRPRRARAALLAAATLAALLAPAVARAEDPVFEMEGKVGYVSSLDTLGLGGRLGYSYRGFYGGLSLMDYLPVGDLGANSVLAEAEVGYAFKLTPALQVGPLLGVGFGFPDGCGFVPVADPSLGAECSSNGTFVLQPGGLVELTLGHVVFGLAPSALIPFASGDRPVFEIDGLVGVRF